MSLAIALTNKEGKHAGFVLIAGVAKDYRRTSGEHSLRVTSDGAAVSLIAADENGDCFYATTPADGHGEWGMIRRGTRTQCGCAIYAS
jgi:hypothetical protein